MNSDTKKKLRQLGIVFLNFVLMYSLLRLIIMLAERTGQMAIYYIGSAVYIAGTAAAFVAFFCLNGFTLNREERTIEELPAKWSDERKAEFLKKQPGRKARARQLIYVILPAVVTLFISYIELVFIK